MPRYRIWSRAIDEWIEAEDQFAAWDTIRDRPAEDFGLIVTAEPDESADPIPVRTSALMFWWGRDEDAERFIALALEQGLPDTTETDRNFRRPPRVRHEEIVGQAAIAANDQSREEMVDLVRKGDLVLVASIAEGEHEITVAFLSGAEVDDPPDPELIARAKRNIGAFLENLNTAVLAMRERLESM